MVVLARKLDECMCVREKDFKARRLRKWGRLCILQTFHFERQNEYKHGVCCSFIMDCSQNFSFFQEDGDYQGRQDRGCTLP